MNLREKFFRQKFFVGIIPIDSCPIYKKVKKAKKNIITKSVICYSLEQSIVFDFLAKRCYVMPDNVY